MGIELEDKRVFGVFGEPVVDGKDAEVVAGEPEAEIGVVLLERLDRLETPVCVVGELVEGKLFQPDVARVSAGTGWRLFAAVVLEHLADGVGEKLRAGAGAGGAEEVEREDVDGGFHVTVVDSLRESDRPEAFEALTCR